MIMSATLQLVGCVPPHNEYFADVTLHFLSIYCYEIQRI